uniref:Uncharacterized protein n=1 Tax=Tanacetum cinerariifolium TaxID=118510 RepID=A0A699J052_TANCI|nr:hypothetical protein [Tanacetum cinerariifolium]
MELDLEARLIGDLEFGDFLELNDLNKPLKLNDHEMEDLDPEIKDGEIIYEPKIDIVKIRVACVEAKRFYGFITIHDGNDSVTYQMVGSHPTFKHLSNKQCNKIWLLLQVSARDILKENSHSYQKKVSSKESWIWDPNT